MSDGKHVCVWAMLSLAAGGEWGCLSKANPAYQNSSSGGTTEGGSTTGIDPSSTSAGSNSAGTSPSGPDSTTASTTASTTSDPSDPSDPSWWDEGYRFRRVIRVTATQDADVPSEASVWFSFDSAAEIATGSLRADAMDFRVVRCDTDEICTEIDRWIDGWDGDGWDGTDTRVWFSSGETVPAGDTDARTFVYWGNPDPVDTPEDDIEAVFLFADDFESDLSRWLFHGAGSDLTIQSDDVGSGSAALRFADGDVNTVGIHRDIDLPLRPIHVSALLRKEPSTASFGIVRLSSVPHVERVPGWTEDAIAVHCELDSDACLKLVAFSPNYVEYCWWDGFPDNTWGKIVVVTDPDQGVTFASQGSGPLGGPYLPFHDNTVPVRSVAIEGEGQNGVFFVDDYIVRVHLDPWPDVTLGTLGTLPP